MHSVKYIVEHAGWHMLWEVAVSSTSWGVSHVWGSAQLKLLIDVLESALQVVDKAEDRLGKATAGEKAQLIVCVCVCV